LTSILEGLTPEHAALLRPHLGTAFVPRTSQGAAGGPVSKIAGAPWLPDGTVWPSCPTPRPEREHR